LRKVGETSTAISTRMFCRFSWTCSELRYWKIQKWQLEPPGFDVYLVQTAFNLSLKWSTTFHISVISIHTDTLFRHTHMYLRHTHTFRHTHTHYSDIHTYISRSLVNLHSQRPFTWVYSKIQKKIITIAMEECMHAYIHMYARTVLMNTYNITYMYVHVCVFVYVCIHVCMHDVCIYVCMTLNRMKGDLYEYIHVYMYVYT
jgi:hypothetical protein